MVQRTKRAELRHGVGGRVDVKGTLGLTRQDQRPYPGRSPSRDAEVWGGFHVQERCIKLSQEVDRGPSCRPRGDGWASGADLGESVLEAAGELRTVGDGRDVGGDGDTGPFCRGDQ